MQMSNKFVRLTKGLNDPGILIKPEEIQNNIKNPKIDHYVSTYFYNEDHFNKFKTDKTVAGIEDVLAQKIWWDFDCKDDLKKSRKDAIELVTRLENHGIKEENINIYFSGQKGFNVILHLNKEITPKQVKNVALNFAKGLETFDAQIYNSSRILRVPGTKHQATEYYKTPMTNEELKTLKFADLYEMAKVPKTGAEIKQPAILDENLFEVEEVKESTKLAAHTDFDLTTKPRNWKASKWALMQGFIKAGERDTASMILTSTCKALGYDALTTYYMVKSALKKSWERYGEGEFTKEDLWGKIERIFSTEWKGGQYSEKEDTFLQTKAEELGLKELTTSESVDIKGALRLYKDYAKNINKLTLKTGIKEIDDRQRITVGMSFGIIAAPGVGKTSIALQMLHSMSKSGEFCIFFSYDMYAPLIVQKIIQKHWDNDSQINEVFKKYEEGDEEFVAKIEKLITEEYPNVEFCFETAQSIDDIYRTIRDAEQKHGKKCKFIVIDYNELVITDVSDPTQSSNYVAQKVRELASKESLCVLSLFQPNKMAGDPSNEINSYRSAKGGSGIEQSVSLMFGVSRPGFNPRKPEEDRYMSINCVKNRMGPIFSVDLFWNGYKGEIRSLSPEEKRDLHDLRKAKEEEKNGIREDW